MKERGHLLPGVCLFWRGEGKLAEEGQVQVSECFWAWGVSDVDIPLGLGAR